MRQNGGAPESPADRRPHRWTPSGKRTAAAGGSPTRLRALRGSPRPRTPVRPSCPFSITARRGLRSPAWCPCRQHLGRRRSSAAPSPTRTLPEPATWVRRRSALWVTGGWGRPASRYPTARSRPLPRSKVTPGEPFTRASASPPTSTTAPSRPPNERSSKNSASASSPARSTMGSRAS